jgi:protein-disulfide isomerase
MASWAVDFALLACAIVAVKAYQWSVAWRELSRFVRENGIRCGLFVVLGALAFVATVRALPTKRALVSSTSSGLAVSSAIHSASAPPANTGVDPAGHPYTGATQPSLTIVEFSDYQCPHCAKAHGTLRALVQRYPNEIRVVHRHFPLDNDCNPLITRPFHQHSCYYSRLAVCSATFGRFWLANDYLFEHGRDEAPVALETLARIIDVKPEDLRRCLSEKGDALLKPDIDEGLQLHIDGTPTFVIDGQLYTGRLPPNVLEKYPL